MTAAVARVALADSRSARPFLHGESVEAIALDTYGEGWRSRMEATADKEAAHFEAAHGLDWWGKLTAIWQGEDGRIG